MGLALLQRLCAQPGTLTHFVNRGKTYWDGAASKLAEAHPETLFHTKADRDSPSFAETLESLTNTVLAR